MSGNRILLRALALVSAVGALYAFLAMFTQAMLGGTSPGEVSWDRIYIWWVDFPAAGMLFMLAIYLWRTSNRKEQPLGRAKWRVVLLPFGHLLLAGCFYFADFAWYLREYSAADQGAYERSNVFLMAAVLFLAGSVSAFWQGRKLSNVE